MSDILMTYSPAMVLALIDGRKTQTRRVLKMPKWASKDPGDVEIDDHGVASVICTETGCMAEIPLRWTAGDRIWVREPWRAGKGYEGAKPSDIAPFARLDYIATPAPGTWGSERNARYMMRWMSRITLTVTSVRVQRLQDISQEDARAEGMRPQRIFSGVRDCGMQDAILMYRELWNTISGPGAWAKNPWVAAIQFSVKLENIDAEQRRLEGHHQQESG